MKANSQQPPILISFIILLALISCGPDILGSNQERAAFREIAWNHITQEEKEQVIGDWRVAPVQVAEFNGEDSVWVTFDSDSFLGPIIVILDLSTKVIITTLPRF